MVSYAQNAEDVVLMRAFDDVANGFYVDVGAWDPLTQSVTRAFCDKGWTGLNLEPQPARIAMFKRLRPNDTNLDVAASDVTGTTTLLVTRHSSLTTVEASIIDLTNPKYEIVNRMEVRTLPMRVILEQHVGDRPIHFMKVDVEGHEPAVLRGCDLRRHRPYVLVVEATCPTTNAPKWPAWEDLVLNAGYTFALFDGLNRFYVCHERADLLPKLSWGACCLDSYTNAREAELALRVKVLEAQLTTAREELAKTKMPLAGAKA